MGTSLSQRLLSLVVGTTLTACGGGLTLPDDRLPARLEAVAGDGQEGTVGSRLEDPLVVRLTDEADRPVGGAGIVFRFESDAPEAEIDPGTATTDAEGFATAEVRLGTNAGDHTVEAHAVQASAVRTTFDLTAVADDDHDDDDDDEDDDDDDDDNDDRKGRKGKGGKGKG